MSGDSEAPWDRLARLFGPLVIAACGLLAYCNSFRAPFVFDGDNYLHKNPAIRDLWSKEILEFAPTRPVGFISFGLSYELSWWVSDEGYDLTSWHATNLAIHVGAALALFGVARRTFRSPRLVERFGDSAARLGLAIAVLWVVHPLNTQSVTYLYQRVESLMGMFYLASFYAFVRFAAAPRFGWAALAVVGALLAMGTKEVAVTLPVMTVWYDRAFLTRHWGDLLRQRGPLHAALLLCVLFPIAMIVPVIANHHYQDAGILDTTRITPDDYARTQPEIVLHYLRLSFAPWGQNVDYAWHAREDVNWPATLGIGVLVAATVWGVFRKPELGFLGGWWFVILAPTSSIAPIVDLAFEHRTYLPLIAPIALVVGAAYVGVGRLVTRCGGGESTAGAVRAALLAIAVATLTTLALLRNHVWRSEVSLWADAVEKNPGNPRAHYNHGVYLQLAGSDEEIDAAIAKYYDTLRLDPDYAAAYLNLAQLADYRSQWADAERFFRKYLEYHPDDRAAQIGLETAVRVQAEARASATGPR